MKSSIPLLLAVGLVSSNESGYAVLMATHGGQALNTRQLPTMMAKVVHKSRRLTEDDRVCEECLLNDDMVEDLPAIGVQIIKPSCPASVSQILNYMKKVSDALDVLALVEPDQSGVLMHGSENRLLRRAQASCTTDPSLGTNDPLSGCQPNLEVIHMDSAYKEIERISATRVLKEVTVAVLDTGVDLEHKDLVNQFWMNPKDGTIGYNFIDNNTQVTDYFGHGTRCAGIIAAQTNNSIGISSVAGTASVKIMPLTVGIGRHISVVDSIRALNFAVQMGAKVSSNSYAYQNRSEIHRQAIANAAARGHVFVTTSGNNGRSLDAQPAFPCSYASDIPSMLCTGATTSDPNSAVTIASFSNTGAVVNIAAPGTGVLSTTAGGGYDIKDGTSIAAPHVAGVAAILASLGLQGQAITDAIIQSAGKISGSPTPLLNAERAIRAAKTGLLYNIQ